MEKLPTLVEISPDLLALARDKGADLAEEICRRVPGVSLAGREVLPHHPEFSSVGQKEIALVLLVSAASVAIVSPHIVRLIVTILDRPVIGRKTTVTKTRDRDGVTKVETQIEDVILETRGVQRESSSVDVSVLGMKLKISAQSQPTE